VELLRLVDNISKDIEGDAFGKIYEYFLGKFAMSEGRRGGEFFTPTSLVKLMVEIIEPYEGRIYDPACGSGGMFVQSARFVKEHKSNPSKKISIYGQEKEEDTVRLNKMNLAVHGLAGDIKQGISYYEDLHNSINKFDYVMANPPFNVSGVEKEKIKDDPRFPFGIPSSNNANYLWIQIFYSALKKNGRAGFVMPNSASDAGSTEKEIRKKIIQSEIVDVLISVGSNFFYTVTLPCTLWFFDKKKDENNRNKILFIDAKQIFKQIDRAHREFTNQQIEFISNIIKLYRSEEIENNYNSVKKILEKFPNKKYRNIKGLCKLISLDEIENKNWSLSPTQYIEFDNKQEDSSNFLQDLKNNSEELNKLNKEAKILEKKINSNIYKIIK
jgi:type I restriction enzyme M protein